MILNLRKKIHRWVEQELITQAQGTAILSAEQNQNSRSWVLFGVAFIGVTAILAGLVSLIAANWESIPQSAKLACYFGLQAIAGFVVLRRHPRRGAAREAAILFFSIFLFAGIGLIAQIFNLQASVWQGQAFWLVMALPITLFARSALLNHVWVIVFILTAWMWTQNLNSYGVPEFRCCVLVALILSLAAVGFVFEALAGESSRFFKAAAIHWGLGLPLITGSILGDRLWGEVGLPLGELQLRWLLIPWAAVCLTVGLNYTRNKLPRVQRHLVALLLVVSGSFVTYPLVSPFPVGADEALLRAVGAAGFILIWSLAASSAAYAGYRRLFDIASFIIAARFVVIYFQVFGDLTKTGIGLVLSGSVILGAAYLWSRFRNALLAAMGKEIRP